MSIEWSYPIAVIAHGGGYASVVESSSDDDAAADDSRHSLIVATDAEASLELMERLGILGAPKMIGNAREFRWLLESLREPVTHVAFDVDPVDDAPNPKWSVAIDELLEKHLVADYSPWNYPVHVVAVDEGFLSITGRRANDEPMHAVAVFRNRETAEQYMEATKEGELCDLRNLDEAVRFFTAMSDVLDAVALDPVVQEGAVRTSHCFLIETLLEKYLVEANDDPSPKPDAR